MSLQNLRYMPQSRVIEYCKRAITDSFLCYSVKSPSVVEDSIRMIKKIGAKMILRSYHSWLPGIVDVPREVLEKNIDKFHKILPDVVLEAAIFETTCLGVGNIPVREDVFKEFGLSVEKRNFCYEAMLFEDNVGVNKWGKNVSVPDIRRIETKMFFFNRFCDFIDMGFESIHLGQVDWTGYYDKSNNYNDWADLIGRMRNYAAKNARNGWVLINAHCSKHNFIDSDGRLLMDFATFPLRLHPADGEVDHPLEEGPQRCQISADYLDSIYLHSTGGITCYGEECESLPYLVEFDNYGGRIGVLNCAKKVGNGVWGCDEISWFANQPKKYRHEFLKTICEQLSGFNDNGFVAMPGERDAYIFSEGKMGRYYANNPEFLPCGFGDENVIEEIWNSL